MKPIGTNILVKVIKTQEGLIVTPDTALIKFNEAEVLKLGTGKTGFEFEVAVGDTVGIDLSMSIPVSWDGEQEGRYIVDHSEILCRFDDL